MKPRWLAGDRGLDLSQSEDGVHGKPLESDLWTHQVWTAQQWGLLQCEQQISEPPADHNYVRISQTLQMDVRWQQQHGQQAALSPTYDAG